MMSRTDDRTYHQARAEAELQLAEASADRAIATVHRELAALHKRKVLAIVDNDDSLPSAVEKVLRGH